MNIIFLIVLVDELKGIALLLALFFVYKFFSKNNINCEKCDKSGPECFQKENLQTVDRSQETLRSYEVESKDQIIYDNSNNEIGHTKKRTNHSYTTGTLFVYNYYYFCKHCSHVTIKKRKLSNWGRWDGKDWLKSGYKKFVDGKFQDFYTHQNSKGETFNLYRGYWNDALGEYFFAKQGLLDSELKQIAGGTGYERSVKPPGSDVVETATGCRLIHK
jgi:hypothetical protein